MESTIRSYRPDDAEAVVRFFGACEALDDTLEPVTAEGWDEFVQRSYNRAGRDFALAFGGEGAIEGYLYAHRVDADVRHFRILVHPERRRRGIATRLLRVVERQGDEPVLQCSCPGRWEAGAAFLARFGFRAEARSLDMVRDEEAAPAVAPPSGVRLRPARRGDDAAWLALSEEGYRGTPGYTTLTPADLANYRAGPGFHLWIAADADDGAVLGLCHTFLWQGERPFVNSVVVAPAARGRGLGRALTAAGVRTLVEAGHTRVELNVRADNAPAVRIYEELGFRTVDEIVTYRRR